MFHFLKQQSPIQLNVLLGENSTIQDLFEIISKKFKDLKPNNVCKILFIINTMVYRNNLTFFSTS